jgi:folate-binding protein YgfZ
MLPRDLRPGSFFDFSDRTKLRLTGADRVRFINGQITNDIGKATENTSIAACVLNVKGKLNAHIFVSVEGDSILIDADAALRDSLAARLERYIIADDVEVEDITDSFAILHVVGTDPISIAVGKRVSVNRFGLPGFDLWIESNKAGEVRAELSKAVPLCDEPCAEQFRIEQGIPRWGRELTEDTIPVEANLESSCIDYEKGCYIGQEVISRMKMSGQRNKSLYGLVAQERNVLVAGMKLRLPGNEAKEAGWITSATWSDRLGKQVALGYVKRPFNQAGAELRALADDLVPVTVKIVDLPFDASRL